jgi:small conductance mechanosensitive channel
VEEQLETMEQLKVTIIDLAVRFGPRLLAAILVLTAGVMITRWLGRWFDRAIGRVELEAPVRLLMGRIARVLLLTVFVIVALQNLGVELLPLIAGLGVAGAGIALAMQGVLGDCVAGLSIIFNKPFRVGDYISIAGEEGRVDAIQLFSTTLGHPDRSQVVIPNRKIAGEILHNFGQMRQLDVVVGVAYDTDVGAAIEVLRELLHANPRVARTPEPVIQAIRLADSSVNIGVRPWVPVLDYGAATSEINQSILETFRRRGIVIPFPRRDVLLIPAPGEDQKQIPARLSRSSRSSGETTAREPS